jgi:hypothetical protein
MEYTQRTYSPNDEFRDLYVGLGVDGTKSKEKHMSRAIRLIMRGL